MIATTLKKASLIVRHATAEDAEGIKDLIANAYPNDPPFAADMFRSQIEHYPEGHWVAEENKKIIGYCSSIRISSELALKPHTWSSITGNGYATTHNPKGDYLYGIELCVEKTHWNQHIGRRFYNLRKKLCIRHHLKGIVFGGRMEHLAEEMPKVKTATKYLELVQTEKLNDHTLISQFHNGFAALGLLENYFPDKESLNYAVHMIWNNPELPAEEQVKTTGFNHRRKHHHIPLDHIRVATVQYKQRKISSFEEFSKHVEYFIRVAAEYHSDFVLFPESFTMQLLSIDNKLLPPHDAILELTNYTEAYKELMMNFALRHNINIIGGSTPTRENGGIENVAYVFLRDGSIYAQAKVHPTPDERLTWNMKGTNSVNAIMTDCGPIGVLICYDSEFPELARHLVDQGMNILFIPFCTDQRSGYLRVRYCAQARAVENQCYVVIAGNVGNLPEVNNMDVQYAQSCILTPCDFPFSNEGIAADTTPNVETVAFADLNIKALLAARNTGSVLNLKDRRHDLYTIQWHELAPEKK